MSTSSSSSWWLPSMLSWKWNPTSPEKLESAERAMLSAVKTPFEQKMVKVGDHSINTVKIGRGPPLLLLHGFAAGVGFWSGNLDALAKRYTVYAVDMVGFARSSRIQASSWKTTDDAEAYFTDTIEGWANSQGLNKFVLLGHSFGGYISSCYALRHPDRVEHLILADPWGVPALPSDPSSSSKIPSTRFMIAKVATLTSPLMMLRLAGPYGPSLVTKIRADIPRKFSHIYQDTSCVTDYIYHANAQSPPTGEMAFSMLTQSMAWAKHPLCDRLPSLSPSVPVTFIYGQHTWMDPSAGVKLSQKLRGVSKVVQVANAGHHLYIDNHEDFNRTVLNVADDLSSSFINIHPTSPPPGEGTTTEKILTE
eukprot:TRINITY_DN1226_c0_g1_i1.p1 TRINITY_DN1226_c0_g1~~TRINITY_DN1226_c0_g1_i1.p1  ORF type:complete len:365 (+),score=113.37 TRINITY_DN1226_c0_g1_i1:685-1779(+)